MRLEWRFTSLSVAVWLCLAASPAMGQVRLTNLRKITTLQGRAEFLMIPQMTGIRISPDGRYLLYCDPVEQKDANSQDNLEGPFFSVKKPARILLRNLDTQKEVTLPLAPTAFRGYLAVTQPFSGDSNMILLPKVLHAGAGKKMGNPRVTLFLYDIAKGKGRQVGAEGAAAFGILGSKGETMVSQVIGFDPNNVDPNLQVLDLNTGKSRVLPVGGRPISFSPSGDRFALMERREADANSSHIFRSTFHLLVWDLKTGKAAEAPRPEKSLPVVSPVWTPKGNALLYRTLRTRKQVPEEQKQMMMRAWDAKTHKVLLDLPGYTPAAPGPTPTSFFCNKSNEVHIFLAAGIRLYDIRTKKMTKVGKQNYAAIATGGRRMVLGELTDSGGMIIHVADVEYDRQVGS